tara:strand:- start:33 stop:458 length:426 start_codon:yes stop_codon:yes gene_type:complete
MDIINNITNSIRSNVESESDTDTDPQLGKIAISKFSAITRKITHLYEKNSLKDYIGDQDKKNLVRIIQKAADTGQPQVFTNQESGVKGIAEVIQSRELSTQEAGKKDGVRECKTIRQTIILKDKREVIESVVLCKGLDGWS